MLLITHGEDSKEEGSMKMAWAWDDVLSLRFFCLIGRESHRDYELNSVKSTERFFAE